MPEVTEQKHEAQHTATPWSVYIEPLKDKEQAKAEFARIVDETEGFDEPHLFMICADGRVIAITGLGPRSGENAAFILRACNAHDDLVKALKGLIRAGHTLNSSSVQWNAVHDALAKAGAA